nr:chloroplast protein import component Tic20-IV [Passiflora oerstedii]
MLSWCAFTNTVGWKPMSSGLVSACVSHLPIETSMATIRGSWRPRMVPKSRLSKGAPPFYINPTIKWRLWYTHTRLLHYLRSGSAEVCALKHHQMSHLVSSFLQ